MVCPHLNRQHKIFIEELWVVSDPTGVKPETAGRKCTCPVGPKKHFLAALPIFLGWSL
jgi:hypothetical protein